MDTSGVKSKAYVSTSVVRSLCDAYESSLGISIEKANHEGYSLVEYSMVFQTLHRLLCYPSHWCDNGGSSYEEFMDIVMSMRSNVVVVPTDYTRWYDEYEAGLIDYVVNMVTTDSPEDLGLALLERASGTELSASREIYPREDQELMKKISDKECSLIARWRLENSLY